MTTTLCFLVWHFSVVSWDLLRNWLKNWLKAFRHFQSWFLQSMNLETLIELVELYFCNEKSSSAALCAKKLLIIVIWILAVFLWSWPWFAESRINRNQEDQFWKETERPIQDEFRALQSNSKLYAWVSTSFSISKNQCLTLPSEQASFYPYTDYGPVSHLQTRKQYVLLSHNSFLQVQPTSSQFCGRMSPISH